MTRTTQWVYGWLLLLPAMALLVLFTHYPAAATLWPSVVSPPKGSGPVEFVGAVRRPGRIPRAAPRRVEAVRTAVPSIVVTLLMAVWVNERIPGRGVLRLAYFTPTILR
jgi:sn-glycerol 3-phosphate transport system permease protein